MTREGILVYNKTSPKAMNILFSIIIPTLNEEQYLPRLLADLASQSVKNFEVIVVDGKSEDKTKEKALSFEKKFPLTFIEVDKRNVSYQRNSGAKQAKGNYLIFLDADTRVDTDFISHLVSVFSRRSSQILLPFLLPDEKTQKAKMLISIVNSFIRASQYYGRPLSTGGNFFLEKTAFEKIGGFNESLFISEDHEFIHRAYKKGIKAKIVKAPKVTVSMRRGQLEGDATLIYKYVVGFLMYTMTPHKTGLKAKLFEYEMGGHRYDANSKSKMQKSKVRKIDMARVKQLLQLSSIALLIRLFK